MFFNSLNGIPHRPITTESLRVHSSEHGDVTVDVVVNTNLALAFVQTVQAANVLLQCASPRDGHREKKGVETRVIEAFSACTDSFL